MPPLLLPDREVRRRRAVGTLPEPVVLPRPTHLGEGRGAICQVMPRGISDDLDVPPGRSVVLGERRDLLLAVDGHGVALAQRDRHVRGQGTEGLDRVEARVAVLPDSGLPLHLVPGRRRHPEHRHRSTRACRAHGGIGDEPAPDGHIGLIHRGPPLWCPAPRGSRTEPAPGIPRHASTGCGPVDKLLGANRLWTSGLRSLRLG